VKLGSQSALNDAKTQRLIQALSAGDGETRFVGGVVRDSILGLPCSDIDLATTLYPEEIIRLAKSAGLTSKPTGIEHGTVTVIVDGKPYEVTTLRRDVETDGRHAKVAFTDDWREDAARRDFTINAMFSDFSGNMYDYFGGKEDLSAGIIRFVGEARERIREDYLRILRFFRFHAWYGKGRPEPSTIEAIAVGIEGLSNVSVERVRAELFRLLMASQVSETLGAMKSVGVFEILFGRTPENIVEIDFLPADPILRLAALVPGDTNIGNKLRLSKRERIILSALNPPWMGSGTTVADWRKSIYRQGHDIFIKRAYLQNLHNDEAKLNSMLQLAANWKSPVFSLRGRDLIDLGLSPGPSVNSLLSDLEGAWIDSDFSLSREELLKRAKVKINKESGNER
jgi:poly(A) polymerase